MYPVTAERILAACKAEIEALLERSERENRLSLERLTTLALLNGDVTEPESDAIMSLMDELLEGFRLLEAAILRRRLAQRMDNGAAMIEQEQDRKKKHFYERLFKEIEKEYIKEDSICQLYGL
ncbi:hypothetical protein PAV_11c01770 [Paenibacillus alvei DSM 29]|nr:hypothetical protein PAV_11c01770 [Paenibacillus alvei DSM 29]